MIGHISLTLGRATAVPAYYVPAPLIFQIPKLPTPCSVLNDFPGPGSMDIFKGLSGICEIKFLTAVHFSKY